MENLLKTNKSLQEAFIVLRDKVKALENATPITKAEGLILQDLAKQFQDQLDYIVKPKNWNFNFMSGGWNSVFAVTEEEAIKEAKKEYADSETLIPDTNTFRVATESDTRALMSLFY